MDDKTKREWERFLTPEVIRSNLIIASVYISAFEILKNSIIERIRNFYWTGFDENGDIIDPSYESEVLSKNKSKVYASLQWLKQHGAIGDNDITIFNEIKSYRNKIAHELSHMLMEGIPSDLPERFAEMISLLDKIENGGL